mgnify:CR=1 FL=1
MARSSPYNNLANIRSASKARFVGSAEDIQMLLVVSGLPNCVGIYSKSGSPMFQPFLERSANSSM